MSGGPGEPATGRRYHGLPVPFFFREDAARKFRSMEMRDEDVILCSLPKGGTTWCHKILHSLLHGVDDAGRPAAAAATAGNLNAALQAYPEALPPDAAALRAATAQGAPPLFGPYSVDDLLRQPAPRLVSTHLFGERFLPERLVADDGQGRLVVVVRNLKDVLASLHFFRGEPRDGWLGNKHGPGSLARFLDLDTPNAYGSAFAWVRASDELCRKMSADRLCVVYYEALTRNLPAQLDRLAAFLGLGTLTEAKRAAVAAACGFDAMRAEGGMRATLLRRGGVGDWKNHLTPEHWAEFDEVFEARLGAGCALAEPLRHFQQWEVRGLPAGVIAEQDLNADPRTWEKFARVTLVNGMVVRDGLLEPKPEGAGFVRPPSEFNGTVAPASAAGADPPAVFVAEAGRYHLFLSGVCPWAGSVAAARHVLGLRDVIPASVADGQSGAGWCYLNGTSCAPWTGRPGPFFAHELYQAAEPCATSRITVPVLWDTQTGTIVSNDSWSIVKMLATAFAPLSTPPAEVPLACEGGLYPAAMAAGIEEMHAKIYTGLLNAVYRAGIGVLKDALPMAEAARTEIRRTLSELETLLGGSRFLLGAQLTAVDLRLAMTLLRYDSSYLDAFVLHDPGTMGGILVGSEDSGDDAGGAYPNLRAFTRDVYGLIAPTVCWSAFRQYYRWSPGGREGALPDLAAIVASAARAPPAARLAL